MKEYDLAVKGGTLVIPRFGLVRADIGIRGEKITALGEEIPENSCSQVIDASGKFVFPGAVDSHSHIGIYRPLDEDARTESAAAASGGVTTILTYFRTGKSYLNKVGPYKEIFPELMALSRDSFIIDYGYHLAPMSREQLHEMEWLVRECGVSTFKYYMFYKMIDLAGSSRSDSYLMLEDSLDFGFLYRLMKEAARLDQVFKDSGGIRLSVHCENPEIIPVTTQEVKEKGSGNIMKDYSNSRPGWLEDLAIREVGAIANATHCHVNLLHLSGSEAVDAAKRVEAEYPHLEFLLEATLHHLGTSYDNDYGLLGKVNPPVRDQNDVEYLWNSTIQGDIKTVVSDHACSSKTFKKGDLWTAMPGFGGTSLMFPLLVTEGHQKRGMPLQRIAELSALNPAIYHHLYPKKGTIMIGSDADLAIIDLNEEKEVTPDALFSAQDFTPFEGLRLRGWADCTILRGKVIFEKAKVMGRPGYGAYIKRPVGYHQR
jgi:dihydropyrimidinase/allantoinase